MVSENFLVSLNFSVILVIFESCQDSVYSYYNNHSHLLRSKSDSSLISGAFISGEAVQKEFRRHQQSGTWYGCAV